MSLLSELKRRNVIRMGLLYVVSSWLILQVADVLAGLFGFPDWTMRFVGFPVCQNRMGIRDRHALGSLDHAERDTAIRRRGQDVGARCRLRTETPRVREMIERQTSQ